MRLDPFTVRTDRSEVEAFARATGWRGAVETVPFTFPFRWLTGPIPRAAINRLLGSETAILPVHEGQTFERIRDWQMDRDYRLTLDLRRENAPDRLTLRASIATREGDPCGTLETVLRLVSRQDLQA